MRKKRFQQKNIETPYRLIGYNSVSVKIIPTFLYQKLVEFAGSANLMTSVKLVPN